MEEGKSDLLVLEHSKPGATGDGHLQDKASDLVVDASKVTLPLKDLALIGRAVAIVAGLVHLGRNCERSRPE